MTEKLIVAEPEHERQNRFAAAHHFGEGMDR